MEYQGRIPSFDITFRAWPGQKCHLLRRPQFRNGPNHIKVVVYLPRCQNEAIELCLHLKVQRAFIHCHPSTYVWHLTVFDGGRRSGRGVCWWWWCHQWLRAVKCWAQALKVLPFLQQQSCMYAETTSLKQLSPCSYFADDFDSVETSMIWQQNH